MDGSLGIAVVAFLVIGICVQLAVALRNKYVKVCAEDAGVDAESGFDKELELQLQGELDDAIRESTPFLSSASADLVHVSPTTTARLVRFDGTADESSWTAFKRESRAKLEWFAKSLRILSKDEPKEQDIALDATPHRHLQPPMIQIHHQRSVRRQLPLLDSDGGLGDTRVMVNAKQYSRILKRRYARQLIEDYFRSQPQPKSRSPRATATMQRARGSARRFLTAEQVRQMEAGVIAHGTAA